jgi:hypothetical protein
MSTLGVQLKYKLDRLSIASFYASLIFESETKDLPLVCLGTNKLAR